ncbi:hypothetical protein LCGC14_0357850 [marine sediment metagenome]|uniref:Uncharacterized protein n=1 Tax=marine sediment metagenome TaxID=412755 RepID=A0A0F9T8V0_9ZZZZ
MSTYPVKLILDDGPTFEKPLSEILSELSLGGAIKILSAIDYITDAQRRWYKGVCLPALVKADENGETAEWWDTECKRLCGGLAYLKRDVIFVEIGFAGGKQTVGVGRLTTKGVGIRKMTAFIEEILSQAMQRGWPVSPPDPELRK